MRHPFLYKSTPASCWASSAGTIGRDATLDDVPDALLDEIAGQGFEWVWFLGVWQTGDAGRQISRSNPKLRAEFAKELADLREEDIVGSPFAVTAWTVHEDFGGDEALARLRRRLSERGLKLLLDFVPNHLATDHPWIHSHSEYFVVGSEEDIKREPQNYMRVETTRGSLVFAHGRDPYFDGWSDTAQLNYRHAGLREAQVRELGRIAERCDGVRCDMAMLLQPEVFARTWGERARPLDGSSPQERRSGPTRSAPFEGAILLFSSWRKSIGISSGTSSKRGSIAHTTSAFTTGFAHETARRPRASSRGHPVPGAVGALHREPRRATRSVYFR